LLFNKVSSKFESSNSINPFYDDEDEDDEEEEDGFNLLLAIY